MICFDECGPLELRPLHGRCWAAKGHPQRLRATYRRLQGTEQLLAFYDVHAHCLVGQVRKRKTHRDVLAVFRRLLRRKNKAVATTACGRQLLTAIYHMLLRSEAFTVDGSS